jgi:hypothetical protein
MDNRRRPENDLLIPPYVYVKIIWRITSYSTLFILKRNTGNFFFTFCSTYVSQESFLKKSVRKRCLEPRAFVYSLTHLPFSFRVSIYERLSAHNSARALKVERNCIPVRGTVNRSPDNRGSTVFGKEKVVTYFKILCQNSLWAIEKKQDSLSKLTNLHSNDSDRGPFK